MKTTRIVKIGSDARAKELKAQLEKDPLNVNVRLMLASQLEVLGRMPEALQELETSITKARRNLGVAYCNFAVALMNANHPQSALQHFDHAIEVDPANASFYLANKAQVLRKIGLEDKARAIYDQVLRQPDVSKETRRIVLKSKEELK